MSKDSLRFPAEWEPSEAVLLAWPHADTDWNYILDDVRRCFSEMVSAISRHANVIIAAPDSDEVKEYFTNARINTENVRIFDVPTNDTWARDFGPITLMSENNREFLDFKFNGWGLKFAADCDNLITSRLYKQGAFNYGNLNNRLGFVFEGGSIETDGKGILMTTSECLLSPNRNGQMSKTEIEKYLLEQLNCHRMIWIDYGALEGDDTDSHIDTLARLAPDESIVYVKCHNKSDSHFDTLDKMERQLKSLVTESGKPFNLIPLPLPDPIIIDGERLPATYANYLVINDAVILPVYNQTENDGIAVEQIKKAFPNHHIYTIDSTPLIRQHGSIHCMTMQIPAFTEKR